MDNKYYVTMTDRFMSGWGMAQDKINKLVIACDTYDEAIIVRNNARDLVGMKHINIRATKPHYNNEVYYVSNRDKTDCGNWFKKDAFRAY